MGGGSVTGLHAIAIGLFLALAGCSSLLSGQAWVRVVSEFPENLNVEIGDSAWLLLPGDGTVVITPAVGGSTEMQFFSARSCDRLAAITVIPGSAQAIVFARDGSWTIEDQAGNALEMGPGLDRVATRHCASLTPG